MARGAYGLVVDHDDGTVSKILRRSSSVTDQKRIETLYTREIDILTALNGRVFGTVKIPTIVDKIILPENEGFFASYRMTKLPGARTDWIKIKDVCEENRRRHFRSVGAMLAHFHEISAQISAGVPPVHDWGWADAVPHVQGADGRLCEALTTCDAYLKTNLSSGDLHGDVHHFNIMVDPDYEVTGLIDFSFSGLLPNRLLDFTRIPSSCLPYVLEEYIRHGGRPVDAVMMTMTKIGRSASIMNWFGEHPEAGGDMSWAYKSLLKNLNQVSNITGLSFPAPP